MFMLFFSRPFIAHLCVLSQSAIDFRRFISSRLQRLLRIIEELREVSIVRADAAAGSDAPERGVPPCDAS